jgi:hypothetical protein
MKYLFAVLLIFAVNSAFSQTLFARLPRLNPYNAPHVQELGIQPHAATITPTDSIFNAIRPIVIGTAYAYPGNLLMAGAGLSYQHLDYNYGTQLYSCTWSVSVIGFAGGSVVPSTPASIMSVGIMGGYLNNAIELGPIYNFGTKQFGIAAAWGINFNN